jgi:hypothetical protein
MTMQEILPSEWRSFLERFTRQHRAWLATMHWVPAAEAVMTVQGVALESVSLDDQPSDKIVRLCFLDGPALRLEGPRSVRVEQTDRGAECALEIQTAAGGLFRLAFRATALPEELDGMAPGEVCPVQVSRHVAEKQPPAA